MTNELRTHATGSGTNPVVFLHGVFMDHTLWDDVVDRLDGPEIRFDMPGHGASAPMPAGSTLDDHVASVIAELDGLRVGKPIIVGHSWGGMVAIRLATQRSDLVGGLVLTNVPLRRTRGTTRFGFWMQRALLAAGFPLGIYARLAARSLMGDRYRKQRPDAVEALETRMKRMGRRQVDETLRSVLLEPGDAVDLVAELEVPWVAVAGRDDYAIADGVAAALRELGDLHVVDGAHTTPLEQPQAIVDVIERIGARVDSVPG